MLWTVGKFELRRKRDAGWQVNQWLKKAVLMSFRLTDSAPMEGHAGAPVWDKVPMKFAGWGENRFKRGRISGGSRGSSPAIGVYCAGSGLDAELRQCRRASRSQHDGRYLGDSRKLRANRRELPSVGRCRHWWRTGATASQPGDHRG